MHLLPERYQDIFRLSDYSAILENIFVVQHPPPYLMIENIWGHRLTYRLWLLPSYPGCIRPLALSSRGLYDIVTDLNLLEYQNETEDVDFALVTKSTSYPGAILHRPLFDSGLGRLVVYWRLVYGYGFSAYL